MKTLLLLAPSIIVISAVLAACSHPSGNGSETAPAGRTILSASALQSAKTKVNFTQHVKPILEGRCVMCHNRKTLPGRMSLENKKLALQRGATAMPIWPGHPDNSQIITKINSAPAHTNAMPPVGERITEDEIAVLTKWIKDGADWPEGRAGRLNPDWHPRE